MTLGHLQARNLNVTLGGNHILHDVSVDFTPGLMHGVLGPNGCGKTTLLRALSGALQPQSGEVLLDDSPIAALSASALARQLAVVWQGGTAPADLTVERLVGHGRYAHQPWWQLSSPKDDEAVALAMQQTGTQQWAKRRVVTLSGGERQRVWIATALAQQPKVLLLDEPTTYLDIAHQIDVLDLIAQLNRDTGLTVIAVLHDLTQAARYCQQIKVMNAGRLRREGSPQVALDEQAVAADFDVNAWIALDPDTDQPVIAPRHRISSDQPPAS